MLLLSQWFRRIFSTDDDENYIAEVQHENYEDDHEEQDDDENLSDNELNIIQQLEDHHGKTEEYNDFHDEEGGDENENGDKNGHIYQNKLCKPVYSTTSVSK